MFFHSWKLLMLLKGWGTDTNRRTLCPSTTSSSSMLTVCPWVSPALLQLTHRNNQQLCPGLTSQDSAAGIQRLQAHTKALASSCPTLKRDQFPTSRTQIPNINLNLFTSKAEVWPTQAPQEPIRILFYPSRCCQPSTFQHNPITPIQSTLLTCPSVTWEAGGQAGAGYCSCRLNKNSVMHFLL